MATEWELADKVVQFFAKLPPHERWALAGLTATGLSPVLMGIWNFGRSRGRKYEVLHGQVPALALQLDNCRHENLILSGKHDRASEQIRVLEQNREIVRSDEIDLPADVVDVLKIRETLVKESVEVWRLREAQPPPHLRERLLASGLKVITVGNLKGGVGKTTLVSNLAAFFDRNQEKRVLVIDLDYQGSLSATMLQAANRRLEASQADHLLGGQATGRWLVDTAKDMAPTLANTRLIPAGYTLAAVEEHLMMRWLFHTADQDVRFNLAELMLSKEVQDAFDVVLLDVGPRLTTASISALCASTHLLVPTNLDKLSAETIGSFLNRVKALKQSLDLPLELAGVVGTMTFRDRLTPEELDTLGTIRDGLQQWNGTRHVFERTIPRRQLLANVAGTDIGYLKGRDIRSLFDTLGQELATRIGL